MEFVKSEVEVKVYGETYKMRLPTYKETINYRVQISACGDDESKQTDCLFDFLSKLGLPEAASDNLEIHHMSQLIDMLLKKTT
jgi:hypothetical protein